MEDLTENGKYSITEVYDKTSVDSLNFHILTPYPSTELRRILEKEGRILHNEWDKYDTRHAVFKPVKMSPEQLQEGYEWAWKQSFSLGMIGKRVLRSGHPIYSAIFQLAGMLDHASILEEDGLVSRAVSRFVDKHLKEAPLTARDRNNVQLYCQEMSEPEGCGMPGSYFNEAHYNSRVWDHL